MHMFVCFWMPDIEFLFNVWLHKLDFSSQEGLFTIRKVAISNNVMVAAIVSKCAIIRSTLNTSGSDEEIEISK